MKGKIIIQNYQDRVMNLRKEILSCENEEWTKAGYLIVNKMRHRILSQVNPPLTTFKGTLKQTPKPPILNETAQTVINTVFPTFLSKIPYDPSVILELVKKDLNGKNSEFLEAMANILANEQSKEERQERRFAGDKNLQSGRYFTVCESDGDDSQTLCRELFAYIDSEVPGWAFISDSWDKDVYNILGGENLPIELKDCLYVMLLEPFEDSQISAYRQAYNPVFEFLSNPNGLKIFPIPVHWFDVEIPHVLDLRIPEAQEWLFNFFRAGDNSILIKPAKPAESFFDMLPAMIHPYRGGSGVTAGIGSWLRTMGINALIYPSARSDAMIKATTKETFTDYHGWCLVLFAGANIDKKMHSDTNPWYPFEQLGYKRPIGVKTDGLSWNLFGIEEGYTSIRHLILAALIEAKG